MTAVARAGGYEYKELAQACEAAWQAGGGHRTCNLYAVVAEASQPRRTRGTDMICNLILTDPSIGDNTQLREGVEVLCFARNPQQLPRPRRPGDIIRMHRVELNIFNERPQLLGKVRVPGVDWGPSFSFCLFDASGGNEPYQTSHAHYHFDEREAQILATFREYVAARGRQHLLSHSEYLKRIKDVRPGAFFDVVGRVLAADDSNPRCRVLWLWDDSDAVPLPCSCDTRHSEDRADAEVQQFIQQLRPVCIPYAELGDLSSIPLVGTALPVILQATNLQHWPAVGSWVKMRNLGARAVDGQLQAYYHRSSKWTPWEEDSDILAEQQQRLEANQVAGWAPPQRSDLLALCAAPPEQPYSTLRQVLLETPNREPQYYRVLVRVLDYSPRDPGQMVHDTAALGLEDLYAQPCAYTLQLLLEDASGQLDALLFGADADEFFGAQASDLQRNRGAREALLVRLDRLLGVGNERPGGPWLEVCLKTHYTDLERPWETRHYLIVDTHLTF